MISMSPIPLLFGKMGAILLCSLLLAGCQLLPHSAKETTKAPPGVAVAPAPVPVPELAAAKPQHNPKYDGDQARLQQCQGQLDALKTMDPVQYKRMRSAFDYLMNGAAQYADVRNKTNADTQDTVDSLYRYRSNLLCAQIAQRLLDSLTNRGEARP